MSFVEYALSAALYPDKPTQIINKRPGRKTLRPGITLIDLIVTILIIGIVSAVTLPRMAESYQRHYLQSAAAMLSGHLSYLKRQAIIRGRSLTVQLSSSPPIIACSQVAMPNQPGQSYKLDLATEFQLTEMSWDGIVGPEIRFDRHGHTYSSEGRIETWSIRLKSANSSALLAISPDHIDVTVTSP